MDIIESLLPMKLDLYVQSDKQDLETGAIKKEWSYHSTIDCYAKGVISNSTTARSSDQQVFNNRYQNEQMIQIRTIQKLNLRHKITGIRTQQGTHIWTELDYPTETPTTFEIIGVTPVTDPFGGVIAYNTTARRSENQIIGI